jgi:RHH-type proline utilization regulon transcriptional repressor/proline dehydrogenase/delta 1-pyrroline-5-carboxylate dehydrogenase
VRLSEGEPLADLLRVVAAGLRAGSALTVSTAHELPAPVRAVLTDRGVPVRVEDDAAWLAGAPALGGGRVRLIGGDRAALIAATGSRPDLAVYAHPVTGAGRVELLPFLHEQAISITAHRFGTPNHLTDELV